MKKFLIIICVIFFCLASIIGIGLYALDKFFSGFCGNNIFQETTSPDHKFKAILFQRDCGATTGFSTQISIIPADEKLGNDAGNIFIADGHPNERKIELIWLEPGKLSIKNTIDLHTHQKATQYQDILIHYE